LGPIPNPPTPKPQTPNPNNKNYKKIFYFFKKLKNFIYYI